MILVKLAAQMATACNEQAASIKQIDGGIEEVAAVVENNSATAEQSAAASQKLYAHAQALKQLVEVKKLLSILKHVKTSKEEIEQEVEQEFKEKVVEEIVKEYELKVIFEEGAEMENIRSYALIHNLEQYATIIAFKPEKILEDESSIEYIKKNGFEINLSTKLSKEESSRKVEETFFIKT